MNTKLFFLGLFLYLIAFIIPVGEDMYGYSFALFPFDTDYAELEDYYFGFLASITNIAVLVTLVAYFKFSSRFVSVLGVVGVCAAMYWMIDVADESAVTPYATLTWMTGSILIALAYELKRRGARKTTPV